MEIERVVCLNLAHRPDRREMTEAVFRGLNARWPEPEFFPAADGAAAESAIPAEWDRYGAGAWGCWTSHRRIWSTVTQTTLVCEDDVSFIATPDVIDDWLTLVPDATQLAFLGGQHNAVPKLIKPHVMRGFGIARTHAYVINPATVEYLLDVTVDCVGHIDTIMAHLMATGRLFAVSPLSWFAIQRSDVSDITGQPTVQRGWPLEDSIRGKVNRMRFDPPRIG